MQPRRLSYNPMSRPESIRPTDSLRRPTPTPAPTSRLVANPAEAILNPAAVWAKMAHAWNHIDPNGSPTHFPTLADWWSWMPGEVSLVTGWPGHGKSKLMLQLMLVKSVYDGWKWALLCPENMPEHKLIRILVEAYTGQSCNPKFHRMSFAEYEAASQWVLKHFFVINPRLAGTLKEVLAVLTHAVEAHGINGALIDPWNALDDNLRDYGGREDEMLKHLLGAACDFAEDYDQCLVVCAHPAGEARNKDLQLVVPDQFKVSGGRMWGNKVDNVLVVHRPNYDTDPADDAVDIHVRKVKEQPETGFPTPAGGVRLQYERSTGRYLDPELNLSPLTPKAIQRFREYGSNNLDDLIAGPDNAALTPSTEFDSLPTDRLPNGARLIASAHD